jgi:hypothetical protein
MLVSSLDEQRKHNSERLRAGPDVRRLWKLERVRL